MRFGIAIVFLVIHIGGFSQFTIIPTSTTSSITEIQKEGDFVLINGIDGYLAKCYGDCDELFNLTVVGDFDYKRDNLHLIDTSTFYMTSQTDFPHHGYVFKSVDGGYSWETLLDTNDILFEGFVMFDTLNGFLISSLYNALSTADEGGNWADDYYPLLTISTSLKINDSTAILGVLEDIRYTTDKGDSWSGTSFVQSSPVDFYATSLDSVYAVTIGGVGQFFSYNFALGESAWQNENISDFLPLGLHVKSVDEIYVVGQIISSGTGGILKTTNLGETWGVFDTEILGRLNEIDFLNDTVALIGGSEGLLIKWNVDSPFSFASTFEEARENVLIKTYPNPASEKQYLQISNAENAQINVELYSVDGKRLKTVCHGLLLSSYEQTIEVDLSGLNSGIYYYVIHVNGSVFTEPLFYK